MSKPWKPGKKTVELQQPARGSRIRRDPVPAEKPLAVRRDIDWRSREMAIVVVGILLFALAINALTLGVSVITGN